MFVKSCIFAHPPCVFYVINTVEEYTIYALCRTFVNHFMLIGYLTAAAETALDEETIQR